MFIYVIKRVDVIDFLIHLIFPSFGSSIPSNRPLSISYQIIDVVIDRCLFYVQSYIILVHLVCIMMFLLSVYLLVLYWYLSTTRSYNGVLVVYVSAISKFKSVLKKRYITDVRAVYIFITFFVGITVTQVTFWFTAFLVTSELHFCIL